MSITLDLRSLMRRFGPLYHLNEHQSINQFNLIKTFARFILDESSVNQPNRESALTFEPGDRRVTLTAKRVVNQSILQSINQLIRSDYASAINLLSFSVHAAVYSFPQILKQSNVLSHSRPLLIPVTEVVSDLQAWTFLIDSLLDQLIVTSSEPYQALIDRSIDKPISLSGYVRGIGPVLFEGGRRMRRFTLLLNVNPALSSNQSIDDKDIINTSFKRQINQIDRKSENQLRKTYALHRYQLDCQAEDETINCNLRAGALVNCVGVVYADDTVKQAKQAKRSMKTEFCDGGVKLEVAQTETVAALLHAQCVTMIGPIPGTELLASSGLQPALALRDRCELDLFDEISSHRLHAGLPSVIDEGVNATLLLSLAGADPRSLPSAVESPHLHTLVVCDRNEEDRLVSRRLLSALAMCVPRGLYADCAPQNGKIDQVPFISLFPVVKSMMFGSLKTDQASGTSGISDVGALAMCDGGHCFIDSIDCLPLDSLPHLSSAMSTGKVSASWRNQRSEGSEVRSFVHYVAESRCTVVAACSTREPEWNEFKSLTENIDLPMSFIQSFDLIVRIGESTRTHGIDSASMTAARWEAHGASKRQRLDDNPNEFDKPSMDSASFTHYMEAVQSTDRPNCLMLPGSEVWDTLASYRAEKQLSRQSHIILIKLALAHARCNWSSELTLDAARIAIRVFEMSVPVSEPLEKKSVEGLNSQTKLTVSSIKRIWKTLQRSISQLPDTEDGFISHNQFDTWLASQNVNISLSDSDAFTQQLCDQSSGELLRAPGGFKWNGRR